MAAVERADVRPVGGSPLFHPGWLAFNQRKWGLTPRAVRLTGDGAALPAIEAVFYLDRRRHIVMPPLNPYMATTLTTLPTQARARVYRQVIEATGWLAAEMYAQGMQASVALPPDVADVRAWQWARFNVGVRYTFVLDLGGLDAHLDPMVRNRVAKAARNGYRCERGADLAHVQACLRGTEARQGFEHRLDVEDLAFLRTNLGEERFRAYVCYAPDGEPASTFVALYEPGGDAIGWVAGTAGAHLAPGAAQLVMKAALADLAADGARQLDWAGANIRTVAAAKANWGPRCVPYYVIEAPGPMGLARYLKRGWRFFTEEPHG